MLNAITLLHPTPISLAFHIHTHVHKHVHVTRIHCEDNTHTTHTPLVVVVAACIPMVMLNVDLHPRPPPLSTLLSGFESLQQSSSVRYAIVDVGVKTLEASGSPWASSAHWTSRLSPAAFVRRCRPQRKLFLFSTEGLESPDLLPDAKDLNVDTDALDVLNYVGY